MALAGLDWRTWSVADFYAVTYVLMQRVYADDLTELRDLYQLVGDKDALAVLARETMGQAQTIQTDR